MAFLQPILLSSVLEWTGEYRCYLADPVCVDIDTGIDGYVGWISVIFTILLKAFSRLIRDGGIFVNAGDQGGRIVRSVPDINRIAL